MCRVRTASAQFTDLERNIFKTLSVGRHNISCFLNTVYFFISAYKEIVDSTLCSIIDSNNMFLHV